MTRCIGIDIQNVHDFVSQTGRFYENIFTKKEITYCKGKKEPHVHFAGKFAAKEAVLKALEKNVPLRSIEILNDKNGKPYALIKNRKGRVKISISHTEDVAIAVCII